MTYRHASLGLAVGAVALAGCQLGAKIAVTGSAARPHLIFTYEDGKPACPRGVTVTDAPAGKTLWAIRLTDAQTKTGCTDSIDYGVAPAGYEVVVPAVALAAGRRYDVTASGTGWHAATAFTPSA